MSGLTVDQLEDAFWSWLIVLGVGFLVLAFVGMVQEVRAEARRRGVKWWNL